MGELGGLTIRPRQTGWFAFSPGAAWLFARCSLAFGPVLLGLSALAALPLGLGSLAFRPVQLELSAGAAWAFARCSLAFGLGQLGLSPGAAWLLGRCCLGFWLVRLGLSAGAAWLFGRGGLGVGRGGVGQRLRCGPWPFSGIRSRSGSAGSRGGRSMRA